MCAKFTGYRSFLHTDAELQAVRLAKSLLLSHLPLQAWLIPMYLQLRFEAETMTDSAHIDQRSLDAGNVTH